MNGTYGHRWITGLLVFGPLACPSLAQERMQLSKRSRSQQQDAVTKAAIDAALHKGIDYLAGMQDAGRWLYKRTQFAFGPGGQRGSDDDYHGGLTALALFALASAGMAADAATITEGIAWCRANPTPFDSGRYSTYSASLLLLALARIEPNTHKKWIHDLAGRIAGSQLDNGMWNYQLRDRGPSKSKKTRTGPTFGWMNDGDGSNTQFAVMALWTAQTATQYRVPTRVWKKVRDVYGQAQQEDGGFSYKLMRTRPSGPRPLQPGVVRPPAWMDDPNPAMTAAGTFAYTCATAGLSGGSRGLAKARRSKVAERGLAAFRADRSRWSRLLDNYAFTYAVERVGSLFALPASEWYDPVAAHLVRRQSRNGSWRRQFPKPGMTSHGDDDRIYETSLALLALSQATGKPTTGKR